MSPRKVDDIAAKGDPFDASGENVAPPRRGGLARLLGITEERKEEIYLRLARSAALGDANYWLSNLLAAGIATLGLVLNSPAVIIGAMLISPLMGPILSAGLALAAGDLVLGVRTALNLLASCALAHRIRDPPRGGAPLQGDDHRDRRPYPTDDPRLRGRPSLWAGWLHRHLPGP